MEHTGLRRQIGLARAHTDELFRLVEPAAMCDRPIPERNRIVFYLGHLEAFDWNLIGRRALDLPGFDPDLDRLFSFGIDPKEGDLPDDQPGDWPALEDIHEYNCRVRRALDQAIDGAPEQLLHVALEHRLMHAETFAYMLHNLPLDRKLRHVPSVARAHEPEKRDFILIPAGSATLGLRPEDGFGWDNEFAQHSVFVPEFRIARYKVTNSEYLEFVKAGAEPPHFWIRRDGEWFQRCMFAEVPLQPYWPVYVTQREARDYAAWTGRALPTEAQFHRAAYGTPTDGERTRPWGNIAPDASRGNFNFQRWDPLAVNATPGGDSAFGVSQLVGNGWEWTSTLFAPFEGFQPFEFYPGYSANFFDGDHYVAKGASARTAAPLLRRSFRNWYRVGYPHTYAGFRCVEN